MMTTFIRQETVVVKGTVRDELGALITPSSLPSATRITILDPFGIPVVENDAVVYEAEGVYHYLYNPFDSLEDGAGLGGLNTSPYNAAPYNGGIAVESVSDALSLGAYHVRITASDAGPIQTIADSEFLLVD